MQRWEAVTINNFSGPLDLLLTLVREKKLNILELNLIELTDQYLDYINQQQELDIEIASEYLLMAATLIELKSKWLLPQTSTTQAVDDYSYEDFVEQLSKYEQFRTVSDFFAQAQEDYFNTRSPKKSQRKYQYHPEEVDQLEATNHFSLEGLSKVYKRVWKKHHRHLKQTNQPSELLEDEAFSTIENNILSPREVSNLILETMKTNRLKEWSMFAILNEEMINLTNLISVFLATLDLVKYQIVSVREDEHENELYLRFTKYALENPDTMNGLEVENYD